MEIRERPEARLQAPHARVRWQWALHLQLSSSPHHQLHKREMKNKTKSITHTKIQKKMRETREKDLVPESVVKWRRLKREAGAEGEMRDWVL